MQKEMFICDIQLSEKDEFSKRFNIVSDRYQLYKEAIGTENEEALFNQWYISKLALEQGYPMPEYKS